MSKLDVHILLVEDDEVDRIRVSRALKKKALDNQLHIATDGIEALEMLRGENGRERLPRPYLVLLDLNMPRMSGLEFLEAVRADPGLRSSIIFVVTTSNDERDKLAAYQSQISGYILKSNLGEEFIDAVAMLQKFVLTIQFPPEHIAA